MPTILENELLRFPPMGTTEDAGNRTVRRLLVPTDYYDNLIELKTAILGTTYGSFGDGTLKRTLPWHDPDSPDQRAVRVEHRGFKYAGRRGSSEPDTPMTGGIKSKYWNLLVTFSVLPFPVGEGILDEFDENVIVGIPPEEAAGGEVTRYCTKVPYPGREFVTPPGGSYYYSTPAGRVAYQNGLPLPVPFQELDVTWWRVGIDQYPSTAIKKCTGRVNATTLTLPSNPDGVTEYAPETVQLLAVRPELGFLPDGGWCVNVRYDFKWKGGVLVDGTTPVNWNMFPDKDGVPVRLYRGKTSNDGPFLTGEFNDLFLAEP